MNKISLPIIVVLMLLLASCHSNKSAIQSNKKPIHQNSQTSESSTRVKNTNELTLAYIESYKGVAQSNMKKYGIPASIVLGQAILESGTGTSPLSVQANNHFGIKCHKDWTGPSIKHDDDSKGECFRKYKEPSESFQDHALFLTSGSRYASLFKLNKTDYKAWAKGLKAAGYATDPQYPSKLIGIIEKYQLYEYDVDRSDETRSTSSKIKTNSQKTETHIVEKGDTLYSISKKYNVPMENLKKQNNILDNAISVGQSILIIK